MAIKLPWKKWIMPVQLLITGLLIWVIFGKLGWRQIASGIGQIGWFSFVYVLFTGAIKLLLSFLNWESSLKLNPAFNAPRRQVWHSFWGGLTLGIVVPGGHASYGKALLVENTSKKATLFSVFFEKMYQGWTIWMFSAVAASVYFAQYALGLRIAAIACVALAPFLVPILLRLFKINHGTRENYIRYCPRILLAQSAQQVLTISQYWLLMQHFVHISFFHCFVSVPLVLFANTIPITIGGLGLREAFASQVLPRYGIDPAHAISVSLSIFLLNSLLPAVPGVYSIFAARRRRR